MSDAADPIEEQKPTADLREQERPDLEDPDDPEAPVSPIDGAEADPADVADQRDEVPFDDDRRDE